MNWLASLNQVSNAVQAPLCSHRHCRQGNWKRWKRRREGLVFNCSWYCGRECLEAALKEYLSNMSPGNIHRVSAHRLPLGLLMLSRGTIDQQHLLSALNRQKMYPSARIGECLSELGVVNEAQITRALGAQNCLPVLLSRDIKVEERVPVYLQKLHGAVCFHNTHSRDRIYAGFGVRMNSQFVKAVEFVTGVAVEPCIMALSFVRECLDQAPVRWRPAEVVFDHICAHDEIVSTIVSYASQVECERLVTVDAGRWLWAELNGREARIHVMFRLGLPKES